MVLLIIISSLRWSFVDLFRDPRRRCGLFHWRLGPDAQSETLPTAQPQWSSVCLFCHRAALRRLLAQHQQRFVDRKRIRGRFQYQILFI